MKYKERLVANWFSQIPGVDYNEIYSFVMDGITFRFLIGMAVSNKLDMQLMDVVTSYLYGLLEKEIYENP